MSGHSGGIGSVTTAVAGQVNLIVGGDSQIVQF
ncbi:hypothetical protein ACSSVZ_002169 [Amorphus sp. MBR-141]